MGHKILIKAFILSILTVQMLFASTDIEIIDKLIKEIKKKRIGLSEKDIKNPFESYIKNSSKKEQRSSIAKKVQTTKIEFRLNAIINNKAKINNKWYKIGSSIDNYKITVQNNQCIELQNSNNRIEVCIKKKKNRLFSILEER